MNGLTCRACQGAGEHVVAAANGSLTSPAYIACGACSGTGKRPLCNNAAAHTTDAECCDCGAQLFNVTDVKIYAPCDVFLGMWECETEQGIRIRAARDTEGLARLQVDGRRERVGDAIAETFVQAMERDCPFAGGL